MKIKPTPSYSILIRVKCGMIPDQFGDIGTAVCAAGGIIDTADVVSREANEVIRDLVVETNGSEQQQAVIAAVRGVEGVELLKAEELTFKYHLGGKLETKCRLSLEKRENLSIAYTPGVARACMAIHENKDLAKNLTIKRNTVAVVSDGTAVLGLGDIGPEAAMPVMEGKCQLFKDFGGVDAFPICVDTKDPDEIVKLVKQIAPTFGGINLEDISAPRCFEIEERLKAELDIPVFHDDQHGTAVVVLAALYNALKIVGKKVEDLKVVVCGAGAAGMACSKILLKAGVKNIVGFDRSGAIYEGRVEDMDEALEWFARHTNPNQEQGSLNESLEGADVFLGLSAPGVISQEDVKRMADDAVIFAMANPVPEIMPEAAKPHARIMATGRSDYPNQINNVLCFPGIFKGALRCNATGISEEMKIAAAHAIADLISEDELCEEYIIPSVFDKHVADAVAQAVERVAHESGMTREMINDETLYKLV